MLPSGIEFFFMAYRCPSLPVNTPTFVAANETCCIIHADVSTVVINDVKRAQHATPVITHMMLKIRPGFVFGQISPYLYYREKEKLPSIL